MEAQDANAEASRLLRTLAPSPVDQDEPTTNLADLEETQGVGGTSE
jgi:hypothetical protein